MEMEIGIVDGRMQNAERRNKHRVRQKSFRSFWLSANRMSEFIRTSGFPRRRRSDKLAA
jgi:hypothetical protein